VSEAFAGMMVTPSVKLLRPLGEGGMGAVWVAEHLALHTEVVVKFIASGLKSNKEAQDRFSREAAAASQVKSPHVVQTFDHGIDVLSVPGSGTACTPWPTGRGNLLRNGMGPSTAK
jgi:serine/threonine-protein kinase